MVASLRLLLDRVVAAAPPAGLVADITRQVDQLNACLLATAVPESDQVSGQLLTIPGRAQLLVPAYRVDRLDDESMAGQVRFGRHYLGSNGAAHGGAISLLFDDVLGRMATVSGQPRSRTAYLHVDYRSVAPIDAELQIEALLQKEEGRKRFLQGVLRDGDRICAEATGLFVRLREGQP